MEAGYNTVESIAYTYVFAFKYFYTRTVALTLHFSFLSVFQPQTNHPHSERHLRGQGRQTVG